MHALPPSVSQPCSNRRRSRMRRSIVALLLAFTVPSPAVAADNDIVGTYRLITSTRKILDTGEIVESYGKAAMGSIMYGADGRFLVLITNGGRPKAESIDKITGEQGSELFRTMLA